MKTWDGNADDGRILWKKTRRPVVYYPNGDELATDAYCYLQQTTFKKCLSMLRHQYSLEQRWPETEFCRRREVMSVNKAQEV